MLGLSLRDDVRAYLTPSTMNQTSILEQKHMGSRERLFRAEQLLLSLRVPIVEPLELIFGRLKLTTRSHTIATSLTFAKLR